MFKPKETHIMAEQNLPEGTDTIITDTIISDADIAGTGSSLGTGGTGTGSTSSTSGGMGAAAEFDDAADMESSLITDGADMSTETSGTGSGSGSTGSSNSGGGGGGVKQALKTSTDKLRSTAGDKAMGFVGQGIERSRDALTSVSSIIGDTAANLDERLGTQYGDYARSASQAIERAASGLANKDPEELIEDARTLVRKSPGVALAGAAILGFALVRVVKSGLEGNGSTSEGRRNSKQSS
ncbi:MAG: hypothetical protein ABR588_02100 [Sphingomicrobium sp.]|nr:hypothetical protein [Sphingomonadales bacterium]